MVFYRTSENIEFILLIMSKLAGDYTLNSRQEEEEEEEVEGQKKEK